MSATQLDNYIPNPEAPERYGGEYTGPPPYWFNGTPVDGVLTGALQGITPLGPNNPEGTIPGIPVMSLHQAPGFGAVDTFAAGAPQ